MALNETPKLPPRRGRWLAASRRQWEAWGRDRHFDRWTESQIVAAERLIRLVEDMHRAPDAVQYRLIADQVRLQERALGLHDLPPEREADSDRPSARKDPKGWEAWWKQWHIDAHARRVAAREERGETIQQEAERELLGFDAGRFVFPNFNDPNYIDPQEVSAA